MTCVSFNANDSAIASGSTSGDLVLHSLTTNVSSKAFGHGTNQVRLIVTSVTKRKNIQLNSVGELLLLLQLLVCQCAECHTPEVFLNLDRMFLLIKLSVVFLLVCFSANCSSCC